VNRDKDLVAVVEQISTIPTLPTVLERITHLLQNPQTSADEIGRAITTDQSLASKVLKLVNSAFYGFPGRISTITHAVVILGFSTIKNIVLTASILDVFRKADETIEGFDMEEFWRHSIACGAAAQALARIVDNSRREECFLGGLLHDLGKIIMCQYLPREFASIVNRIQTHDILFHDAENYLYGSSHQEVGGLLTENWNLPKTLQLVVKYHHAPERGRDEAVITSVVHAADIFVRALDYGNGGDEKIPRMSEFAWKELGLEKIPMQPLLAQINDEMDRATVFMQI
jgi:HD-like signal output (HDOD) protein